MSQKCEGNCGLWVSNEIMIDDFLAKAWNIFYYIIDKNT